MLCIMYSKKAEFNDWPLISNISHYMGVRNVYFNIVWRWMRMEKVEGKKCSALYELTFSTPSPGAHDLYPLLRIIYWLFNISRSWYLNIFSPSAILTLVYFLMKEYCSKMSLSIFSFFSFAEILWDWPYEKLCTRPANLANNHLSKLVKSLWWVRISYIWKHP